MEPRDPMLLAGSLGQIARALLAEDDVEDTLGRIVTETLRLIEPVEHVAIDSVVRNRVEPIAASSDLARRLDDIQAEVDQGPCLDALRNHEVYRTGDLLEESRWPDFARRASQETGVRSIMGFRLWVEEDTLGALNLYSTKRDAFGDETEAVGSVLAAHAGIAWSTARREEQLEEALRTRDLIGQAKGMLMCEHGIGEDEAFDLLREASQRANVKLRDLARQLVDGERHIGS